MVDGHRKQRVQTARRAGRPLDGVPACATGKYDLTVALQTRPVTDDDLPFLAEMTALAAFPPGPLPEAALAMPQARRWLDGWGRDGDLGVIALDGGSRVGAAWCRVHPEAMARDDQGTALPELAIAVLPDHRERRVGTRLIEALSDAAARAGLPALTLVVNRTNPALRLYQRAGFQVQSHDGDRLVMVRQLAVRVGVPGSLPGR